MSGAAPGEMVACLILAAGMSRRFGAAKMRHRMPDGRRVLQATIDCYHSVFDRVHVIARADDSALIELAIQRGADVITNHRAEQGMSQSIVAGVTSVTPSVAWLIALGDMPYIKTETCRTLVAAARADSITVPRSDQGVGNPVVFGVEYLKPLSELTGDVGARAVVQSYPQRVTLVDCDDPGIHQDIDVPTDLLR